MTFLTIILIPFRRRRTPPLQVHTLRDEILPPKVMPFLKWLLEGIQIILEMLERGVLRRHLREAIKRGMVERWFFELNLLSGV